ncbi:hypothetical protein DIPPA_06395 [Diplonema papillatum]|nr:hypothetical protein DIPPA_06395 [Diplonema papillatum]
MDTAGQEEEGNPHSERIQWRTKELEDQATTSQQPQAVAPGVHRSRSSPHSYQQTPDRSATADLRPVQCGCCRSALGAPSGSVVDCSTCGTEIAISPR